MDNKYESCCTIHLAGVYVSLNLRHSEAACFFNRFLSGGVGTFDSVSVPELEWCEWLSSGGSDNGYGEYTCSTAAVSDVLLRHERCIMHAVAFRFGGQAWLISGPSGAGKSTQIRNLQEICPGEFQVICGDRPALELLEDGVFVHPSPWNGKENWQGAAGARLGGLILLERGVQNAFSVVPAGEAVFPLLQALIHTGETEDNIRDLARFADRFLRLVPVYKLVSDTIPDSSRLLYDSLFGGGKHGEI